MDNFIQAAAYYLRPSLEFVAKLSSVIPLWMTAVMIDKHALGIPLLEGSLWHSPRIPPRLSIGANRGGGDASGTGSVRRPTAGDGGSSAHGEGLRGEAAPFGAGSPVRSAAEVSTPVAQPSEGTFFPSESLTIGASSSKALSLYQPFEVFDPFNFSSGSIDSGFVSTVLLLPLLIGYLAALKAGRRHSSSKSQPAEASQVHSKHAVGTQTPELFLLQHLVEDVDLSTFGELTLEELVAYCIDPISESDMESRISVSSNEREELPEVGEESHAQGQQTFLEEQQTFYEEHSAQENEIVQEAQHLVEPDDKGKQEDQEKPSDQRNVNAQEEPNVQEEHVAQGKGKGEEEHSIQGRPDDHGEQKAQESGFYREHEDLEEHRAQEKEQAQKEPNVQEGVGVGWKHDAQEEREGQEEDSVKELQGGQIGYEAQEYNPHEEQDSQAMPEGQEEPEDLGEHGGQQEHDVPRKPRAQEDKSRDTETDSTSIAEKRPICGEDHQSVGNKAAEEDRENDKEDRTPSEIEADGTRKANAGVGNDQSAALGGGTQKKKKKRARRKAKKEAAKKDAAEEASNEAGDTLDSSTQHRTEMGEKERMSNDVEPKVVVKMVEPEPGNVLLMTKRRGEEKVTTKDPATTSKAGAYSLKETDLDDPFFVAAVTPETSLPPRPPTPQPNEKPVPVGLPPKPQFTGLPIPKGSGAPLSPTPASANPAPGSDLLSSLITSPPRPKRSVPPLMPYHQSFGAGQGSVFQNVSTLSGPFTGFGPTVTGVADTPRSQRSIVVSNGAPPPKPSTLGMNQQSD